MKEGVVTYSRLIDFCRSGFGFLEDADGKSVFFSSTAIFQSKGFVDQLEVGDIVNFELFDKPKRPEKGPSARRVHLKAKAQQHSAHERKITTIAGELDT
jgi:cold shock CspA family protein